MKPIAAGYRFAAVTARPGDRLHRLFARLADTHVDDVSDDRVDELERLIDGWRSRRGLRTTLAI